jgi:hypothetical protein
VERLSRKVLESLKRPGGHLGERVSKEHGRAVHGLVHCGVV